MNQINLSNRPQTAAANTSIVDFQIGDKYVRVSLKLAGASSDIVQVDVQAFEVDMQGVNVIGPDGRPSRTASSIKTVQASSLGKTHTMNPGWVEKVGTYQASDFALDAAPANPQVGESYFDSATQRAYEYVEGEKMRFARAAASEMLAIINNSNAIAGISW